MINQCLLALVALAVGQPATLQGPARPNIIFILADDLDYDTIQDHIGKTIDGRVSCPT